MASVVSQHRQRADRRQRRHLVGDVQPLVRLNVQVIAADGARREVGYQGTGGRYELARLLDPAAWQPLVDEAVRIALLNLDAVPCPAGTMDVVLGPGWPGDPAARGGRPRPRGRLQPQEDLAPSADRLGQRVAAPGVTVVDDGTLAEPARLAQRRRRGHADAAHRADRGRRAASATCRTA